MRSLQAEMSSKNGYLLQLCVANFFGHVSPEKIFTSRHATTSLVSQLLRLLSNLLPDACPKKSAIASCETEPRLDHHAALSTSSICTQWFHMAETVGMRAVVKLYFYKMLPDSSPMKSQESLQEGIDKTRAFLKVDPPFLPQPCHIF